jgi:hypothetical protein
MRVSYLSSPPSISVGSAIAHLRRSSEEGDGSGQSWGAGAGRGTPAARVRAAVARLGEETA